MRILILDGRSLYGSKMIEALEKSWQIDLVTGNALAKKSGKVNVILGSRRELSVCKQLSDFYDLVLDTDSLVVEDIENILSVIKTSRYILFSTAQVYRFMGDRVHWEDEIDESYLRELDETYVNYQNESEKFYAREKLRIEFSLKKLCIERNINYTILRISKCYFDKDYYHDIAWIKHRIVNGRRIILREENIGELGMFHPIYENDLYGIVRRIILDKRIENQVLNIAQDQMVSLITLTNIVCEHLTGVKEYNIVYAPKVDSGLLRELRIPCNSALLVSNKAIKELYDVKFTRTEEWVAKICDAVSKDDDRIKETKTEKIINIEYGKYCERIQQRLENASSEETNKSKKGNIVNFYENG